VVNRSLVITLLLDQLVGRSTAGLFTGIDGGSAREERSIGSFDRPLS